MERRNPSRVAVVRCEDYDAKRLQAGIEAAVDALGGASRILENGRRPAADAHASPAGCAETTGGYTLLKPNMLATASPGHPSVTHHAVFEAVARALSRDGRRILYGDSPALHSTQMVARATGIESAAERAGVQVVSFREGERVVYEDGRQNKVFPIARACLEATSIVNIAKLKTHGFMVMTGAVKNIFGCVGGLDKARFHAKLEDPRRFARMVVDLYRFLAPPLCVVDAVEAMEGNGPRNGVAFPLGVVLVATDPVAADTVGARLLGIDPAAVPTIVAGHEVGLGTMDDIEVVGDPLPRPARRATPARGKADLTLVPRLFRGLLKKIWVQSPVIHRDRCIRCYECVRICPTEPKSIHLRADRYPEHTYETCIRCYCCQETCPENAITIRRRLMA